MDIHIKRFALTVIASAIFSFHAEVTSAASCPSEIIGTFLSGVVCDFDAGSSVTVQNGGQVAGIVMNSYNPTSPSQIVINAGGIINNNLGGVGITIASSSLSNGILNNGTISSASSSGITISNSSTINGGLTNNGLISTRNLGILVNHSVINEGIVNSGTITSTSGTGIHITSSSTINGGISNSGTISAGGVDVGIAILNNSIVHDGIHNSGVIEATASGNGITMYNSSTISGGISNSGTISSANNTGIAILNFSQVVGNISNIGIISGGQQALSIHNDSTVSGSIFNNGTITGDVRGIYIFSNTTISGSISNNGNIRGGNTGIAVEFSSTINGGIANSGTIQGDINAIHISPNSIVDIDILGKNARLIGAVDAVSSTVNITSGAEFTSEGTFNVNIFNIATNAIFHMANDITATNMNNAGTLAIANSLQTITGNYTQHTGGVFQTGVTSTTSYGQLSVSGTADLSQSGNINVRLNPQTVLHKGDVLTDVINGGILTEPTDGFHVTDNSFIWKFIATNPGGNGINLTANIDSKAYNACQGDYCEGAANVIIGQIAAGNPAFSPYASLANGNQFKTAASQATPELTNENIQVTQFITRSVMDIVPMWNTLHGQSEENARLYQSGKLWVRPYGGSITQNENNTVEGFDATAYGIVIGKDFQRNEDWLLGGALAFGKDNMSGSSVLDDQTIRSDDYEAMLYASKILTHHLYIAGLALTGYGNNHTKREIPLYGSTAHGSYNSWFTNLRTQLGWSFYATPDLILTPALDASYLFVNQDSYHESGSVMDLKVSSNNNSSLVLGAYGHGAYHVKTFENQRDFTLTGYVGVARNVLNSEPETTATFVAGGPSFTTFGTQFNEFVFRGGVGLTLTHPTKPLRVNVNYDLQTGNNAYSGVGSITVVYAV